MIYLSLLALAVSVLLLNWRISLMWRDHDIVKGRVDALFKEMWTRHNNAIFKEVWKDSAGIIPETTPCMDSAQRRYDKKVMEQAKSDSFVKATKEKLLQNQEWLAKKEREIL